MAETTWLWNSTSVFCSTCYSTFVSKVGITFCVVYIVLGFSCASDCKSYKAGHLLPFYPVNLKPPRCILCGNHLIWTFITRDIREFVYMVLFYLAQCFYVSFELSGRRQSSSWKPWNKNWGSHYIESILKFFIWHSICFQHFCCCYLYSWIEDINSFKPALVKTLNTAFLSLTMLWCVYGCHSVKVCTLSVVHIRVSHEQQMAVIQHKWFQFVKGQGSFSF